MHSGILFIAALSTVCWVIQFLPVISVPITTAGSNLYLSKYNNFSFGVFGLCDTVTDVCSSPQVGYKDGDSLYMWSDNDEQNINNICTLSLPSEAKHSISKLLVVHVIAFVFSSLLVLESAFLVFLDFMEDYFPHLNSFASWKAQLRKSLTSSPDSPSGGTLPPKVKRKRRCITGYLNLMLLFTNLSFLSNLLAFLADVLLFVPKLSWLGWIQLLPITLLAILSSFVCFLKRSISSRSHLNESRYRRGARRRGVATDWPDDSDDGVYIYSNGFQTGKLEDEANTIISHGHSGAVRTDEYSLELNTFDQRRASQEIRD